MGITEIINELEKVDRHSVIVNWGGEKPKADDYSKGMCIHFDKDFQKNKLNERTHLSIPINTLEEGIIAMKIKIHESQHEKIEEMINHLDLRSRSKLYLIYFIYRNED